MKNKQIKITEKNITKALNILLRVKKSSTDSLSLSEACHCINPENHTLAHHLLKAMAGRKLITISKVFPAAPESVMLTNNAYIYLLNRKQDSFRFWLPVIVSFTAVLISVCSFAISILQLLQQSKP
jgi:hypothetical protein